MHLNDLIRDALRDQLSLFFKSQVAVLSTHFNRICRLSLTSYMEENWRDLRAVDRRKWESISEATKESGQLGRAFLAEDNMLNIKFCDGCPRAVPRLHGTNRRALIAKSVNAGVKITKERRWVKSPPDLPCWFWHPKGQRPPMPRNEELFGGNCSIFDSDFTETKHRLASRWGELSNPRNPERRETRIYYQAEAFRQLVKAVLPCSTLIGIDLTSEFLQNLEVEQPNNLSSLTQSDLRWVLDYETGDHPEFFAYFLEAGRDKVAKSMRRVYFPLVRNDRLHAEEDLPFAYDFPNGAGQAYTELPTGRSFQQASIIRDDVTGQRWIVWSGRSFPFRSEDERYNASDEHNLSRVETWCMENKYPFIIF